MSNITQHDLDQVKLITKHEYDRMRGKIFTLEGAQSKFIDWMKTSDSVILLTKGERTLYIVNPQIEVRELLTNKEHLRLLFEEEEVQKPKGNWFTRMFKN